MYKIILGILSITWMVSCNNKSEKNSFTVNGTITDNVAKKIYLEEVAATTMQPRVADSATLSSDGRFSLKSNAKESVVYNLRLDQNAYPVASVINDAPSVDLNIKISKQNNQFAESYEVKGSPASQQMKDFMVAFNNDLQKIFINVNEVDSLRKAGTADSLLFPMMAEQKTIAERIRSFSLEAFKKANDPALLLFELGYYQSTANGAGFGLEGFNNDQVKAILSEAATKFPSHSAITSINKSLLDEEQKTMAASWVGKQAPDFALPDVNGKEVKLSSFKGKYVLVDFWASWCKPCRAENPNVVSAYQQYKDKNFTVLGVSLDRPGGKDDWIKAIKADKLDWTHVSDLQFWNSSVIPLYKFDGIPFNVLVDPEGKVIAEALRGPKLEARLAELLH
jgi:peroxiredoxin